MQLLSTSIFTESDIFAFIKESFYSSELGKFSQEFPFLISKKGIWLKENTHERKIFFTLFEIVSVFFIFAGVIENIFYEKI